MSNSNLDWSNLAFGYITTKANIRYYYRNNKWSAGELVEDEYLPIHMAAPALNYGQEAFEGLKAFTTKKGEVVVFRPGDNARRLQKSCERIFIPSVPEELFLEALTKVVQANKEFVPPYGTGASLYIRPLILGIGPKVGLGPADEYLFVIFVTPVGPYYKGGFKPVKALVVEEFDRAAPLGVGDCKVGGNYAAGLRGSEFCLKKNFQVALYLDASEKKYIDEFSTSNFIAIAGDKYISPNSKSVLPSITNDSLATIAADLGLKVEKRPVEIREIKDFDEIGAVGTAAVLTPVNLINYQGQDYYFDKIDFEKSTLVRLYNRLTKIQTGDEPDKFNWLYQV
jgi:branched-chain amino acid aminotransferase